MAKTGKKSGSTRPLELDRLMLNALAGFEVDSRQACRALRVSIAIHAFGVGTLLENDLPHGVVVSNVAEPGNSADVVII